MTVQLISLPGMAPQFLSEMNFFIGPDANSE